jgi:hypothetical protein
MPKGDPAPGEFGRQLVWLLRRGSKGYSIATRPHVSVIQASLPVGMTVQNAKHQNGSVFNSIDHKV